MVKRRISVRVESRRLTRSDLHDDYEYILTRQDEMLLEQICQDIEKAGYEVQPIVIPACAVNAPHIRARVWILGHAKHLRESQPQGSIGNERRRSVNSGQGSMGDPIKPGLEGLAGDVTGRHEPGRNGTNPDGSACSTGLCHMADTLNGRSQIGWPEGYGEDQLRKPENDRPKIKELCGWSDYTWITGHDGKQRRVPRQLKSPFYGMANEHTTIDDRPNLGLLVEEFPKRADFLKLFGNAIVYPVAREIMMAIKTAGG